MDGHRKFVKREPDEMPTSLPKKIKNSSLTNEKHQQVSVIGLKNGPVTINMLDDDCLAKIFMYIPYLSRLTLERVCRKWRRISELAWYDVKKFRYDYKPLENLAGKVCEDNYTLSKTLEMLVLFERCGNYIQDLDLSNGILNSIVLSMIKHYFPNIKKLRFEITKCDETHFIEFFSNMPKLESLTILWNMDDDIPLTIAQEIIGIADQLKEFTVSSLKKKKNLPDLLVSNFHRFKSLQCLILANFVLHRRGIIKMISHIKSLVTLKLEIFSDTHYDDVSYEYDLLPITHLNNLESLKLEGVQVTDDKFLIVLANNCKKLKKLKVSCHDISDNEILSLTQLEHLQRLYLTSIFKNSVTDRSISNFKNMEKLDLNGCKRVTDIGIKSVLKNSLNLIYLNIRFTSVTTDVIREAVSLTKNRTNNIILIIATNLDRTDLNDIIKGLNKKPVPTSAFLRIQNY